MRLRGSVTLFLALVLTSCCALICALLESARTAGTRYYAALAANAAVDSLFSRYDRTLFARYRILAYRYPGDERCAAELDRAVQAYQQDAGRYPFFEATIRPLETGFLGDGGAVWLEQEMLDYMKTQPGDAAPLTVSLLTQYRPGLTFAEHVSPSVTALSPLFADAAESESLYFRLEQSLLDAGREKEAAAAALAAGNLPDFSQHAAALSAALRQTELISADCLLLSAQLTDGSARFAFSGQAEEAALLPLYETVSETAAAFRARRPEISAAETAAPALTATVSAYETAAAELAARIAEEAEEDDEDDGMGIDAEALWHSLAADFSAALSLPTLSAASGLRQDAAPLSLAALLRTEPATREALCLPASAAVPAGSLPLTELPSAQLAAAEPGASRSDEDDCLFAHYAASFFPCYLSQTKVAAQAGLSLQLEYLSAGKETDRENFSAVCSRLFADQESLRLLALLSDPAACQAAEHAADSLCTAAASPRLRALLRFLLLYALAAYDSLTDLSLLLAGQKAPLFLLTPVPRISADRLLQGGGFQPPAAALSESREGLSYRDALLFFYLQTSRAERNYRMLDLMETALSNGQTPFRITHCLVSLRAELRCNASHLFTALFSLPAAAPKQFQISVQSFRAY